MNIKKMDGTSEAFEVIASFELSDFGKTYVTYTKDDVDVNGNIITYTNTIVDGNLMPVETDEEWGKIKETLLKMTKGSNEDVKKMLRPVEVELVETKTTKAEARHALSISKDFRSSIKGQYDADVEAGNVPEAPMPDAGQDINIPEFSPVVEPEAEPTPVAPVEVAPIEIPSVEPTPMPEPVVEAPVPEEQVVVEPVPVEIPEVEPVSVEEVTPVQTESVDVVGNIDRIIAELEEIKRKLG